jgi:oxalate decarboxylase
MDKSRRNFLGAAALGTAALGSVLATIGAANAEGFAAKAGDGGFGRNTNALPPGEKVVHHDAGDVEAMPDFHFSLDATKPKVTSGGWAKEATVHNFPMSTGIAGVHMYLDPGASRELHWHAIAAEWAYVLDGRCQAMIIDPAGNREVANFGPGDVWFFPKGHGHSIQTIGDKPCHFILSFDNGAFSEHGTFSITDWVSLTPKDMLAENFGVPAAFFERMPKGETYIMSGPVIPESRAKETLLPPALTHKYALMDLPPRIDTRGGQLRLATQKEFPMSKSMSGGVMTLKPGAIREMHWHPNANEWHYYLSGMAEVALFGSGGRGKVKQFVPGDVAYMPAGYGHAIRNTSNVDVEIVITFDSGDYQEISLSDWMAASPNYLLSNNFGVGESDFAQFPKKSQFIRGT